MTHRPCLFISHSSEPDPVQTELLQLIQTHLDGKVEVLLDQALLQAGDRWREIIHTWMGLCEATVILFSRGVIERPDWVRKESLILEWRLTLDPKFVLIPVFLPGFEPGDLQKVGLAPAHVRDIQVAGLRNLPPEVAGSDAAAIFEQIRPRLQPLANRAVEEAPLRHLINLLASTFHKLTDDLCRQEAEKLTGQAQPWDPHVAGPERLARALIQAPLEKAANAVAGLGHVLGRQAVEAVFDLLSANWVPPDATVLLPQVAAGKVGRGLAVVNTRLVRTGHFYIRQAYRNFPPGCPVYEAQCGFHPNFATEVRKTLLESYRNDMRDLDLTDEEVEQDFDAFCRQPAAQAGDALPRFLLLAAPQGLPPDRLRTLSEQFPRFTALLLCPPLWQSRDNLAAEEAVFLEPPLEATAEHRFLQSHRDFKHHANQLPSGT